MKYFDMAEKNPCGCCHLNQKIKIFPSALPLGFTCMISAFNLGLHFIDLEGVFHLRFIDLEGVFHLHFIDLEGVFHLRFIDLEA